MNGTPAIAPGFWARSRHRLRPALVGLVALVGLWLWWPIAPAAAREPLQAAQAIQPYLDRVADAVTEFTLENGMKFIVLERHQAPVVSFMIHANVGAVDETDGKTGVAHYLEHLAFKGTSRIGTKDFAAEQQLMTQLDAVFNDLLAAQTAGDTAKAAELQEELAALQKQAASFVEQNQYGQIIQQAGGVGLNATTSADETRYFYSLPANKLELWMSLESERFLDPVFREFYEEKDVILEERRMRVDNSPIGTMIERFLEEAFVSHPYRRPVIGYQDDLFVATREDVQTFYDTYYGPANLTAAVVGDVDPAEVKRLAEVYFSRYTPRAVPPEPAIDELPQTAPKEFSLALPSEPWYLEGYHRPSLRHPDHVIYGMIESLLMGGRTSRIYKTVVDEARIALDIGSLNGFPGDRYDNIFLIYGLTAPGHTPEEIGTLFAQEIDRIKQEPVSPEELDRVKTQARAGLLQSLASNGGMASLLAEYQAKTGDWRNIFNNLKAIEAVSAADIQRVAQTLFRPESRTVGKLVQAPSAE
ncbi:MULTISPECIES: M16 family metallopeptidase [Cyanophyceae]|uniref:Insulinase family protein n=1 Tax=Leptolyngbya subtilissima DQ-A4 TaxID=2933933 RepID=A0ABV0K0Z3_9CYAN|nr:insulinase family protein [Nodosilinea sp. FACHB-141]MBD2110924.1 insulinase family protein [Nodosilinea sp. FACHB-141]